MPSADIVSINFSFSWRNITKIGLVWGAEYALLALIEDAPTFVKVATLVCALLALATLASEDWIRHRSTVLFRNTIMVLAVIYSCFIAYAIHHAIDRIATRDGLKKIYTSATPLADRKIPISAADNGLDQIAVTHFRDDFENWENASADWINNHLGEAARDHFLDRSNLTGYSWGDRSDEQYDLFRNRLAGDRKNLIAIMESRIYDD